MALAQRLSPIASASKVGAQFGQSTRLEVAVSFDWQSQRAAVLQQLREAEIAKFQVIAIDKAKERILAVKHDAVP